VSESSKEEEKQANMHAWYAGFLFKINSAFGKAKVA
jgi:hypothetical protein